MGVNEIDLHKKSTVKSKFASRSTKSTFIRRALQKLNLPQGHENRPLHEEHPQRGRNNRKENLKTEGQKATTHNHESKPSSKFLQSKFTLTVSHKNKIAFSGQTKGVRRILRLISDHWVPA